MNMKLVEAKWRGAVIRLIAIMFLLAGGLALAMGYAELGRLLLVTGIAGAFTGLVLNMLAAALQRSLRTAKADETARPERKVKR